MDAEITRSTTCQRLNIRRRLSQRKYFEKVNSLTWCSLNWSPPKAATQGLMPPVPRAMRKRPTMDNALNVRKKKWMSAVHCRNIWGKLWLSNLKLQKKRYPHMKGHVVWCPISVWVGNVMNCTDSHRNLSNCIDNGQVDDSPEWGRLKNRAVRKYTCTFLK